MARYIDADALIEELRKKQQMHSPSMSKIANEAIDLGLSLAMRTVREAPTADVEEVKNGRWVRNERNIPKMREFHQKGIALAMKESSIFYTCSCCANWGSLYMKRCPECGAKMDEL